MDPAPAPSPPSSGKTARQVEIFRNRLAKTARHLRRWPSRGTGCFRLYDHDIPEVPLVIDRYEDKLHVAEYEQPHSRSPGEHREWLELMLGAAAEVTGVERSLVFLKRRERQRGLSQYERAGSAGRVFTVQEGGLRFLVNLSDYLDTGLFLDHRITRSLVREEAAGKRFLNLFAYTGSFTVYAAAGGAASTTTVDISNTYLEWAARNLALNGFTGGEHHFVREDALRFVAGLQPGPHFDLVVADPPTFSNSKKTGTFWEIERDHPALLNRLLDVLAPGGVIYFSTNFRKFKLAGESLGPCEIREITARTVPPDFHDRKIHRAWRIRKPAP